MAEGSTPTREEVLQEAIKHIDAARRAMIAYRCEVAVISHGVGQRENMARVLNDMLDSVGSLTLITLVMERNGED